MLRVNNKLYKNFKCGYLCFQCGVGTKIFKNKGDRNNCIGNYYKILVISPKMEIYVMKI